MGDLHGSYRKVDKPEKFKEPSKIISIGGCLKEIYSVIVFITNE